MHMKGKEQERGSSMKRKYENKATVAQVITCSELRIVVSTSP